MLVQKHKLFNDQVFSRVCWSISLYKTLSIQVDITHLEREIHTLVYELYGLTEEEIRIVEGAE
jgi:hypothetical protein